MVNDFPNCSTPRAMTSDILEPFCTMMQLQYLMFNLFQIQAKIIVNMKVRSSTADLTAICLSGQFTPR